MKVLILTNNDVGLFKFRRELLEALLKQYEVYISLPYGAYVEQMVQMGCVYCETNFERRGKNVFADLKLINHYKRLFRKIKPDVVLTYTAKPNIYGGIAAANRKIPQIANITGLGTAVENVGLLQKLIIALYRIGLRNAQVVFFQNADNQRFMNEHKVTGKKQKLLPGSGVNLEQYAFEEYPEEKEKLVFLTIGRIMNDKGINELLEAASAIKKEYPNTRFQLIGPYEEKYKRRVEEAVENNIVEYLGPQDDIRPFLKASHAIVHPSYHEGMSNVLLESSSTGRPVIATNVPGCIETFEPGTSGIACKARDAEDLTNAIRNFIELPYEKKAAMGQASRKHMERHFDRKIVIQNYLEEIKTLMEE